MPINVSWHSQDDKILLWTVGDSWNLEEYYQAFNQTQAMLKDVEQPIYAVVDATNLVNRPRVGLMGHFLKVLREVELDTLIYVRRGDSPPLIQKLLNLIALSPSIKVKHINFTLTVEEAFRHIHRASIR